MNNNNTTYKASPLGKIPGDWEVKFLGDITKFYQGVQVDLEKQITDLKPGYLKFLRIENYTQSSEDFRYIPENDGRNKFILKEDIVIVRYGASAGFIGSGHEGILANNLFKVEPDSKVLDKKFLFFLLRDFRAYKYFQNAMFGGAMPALSFDVVSNYKISLPPLLEQKAIAQLLSTWDDVTAKTQALTTQKETLKKWLMQNLLSGKKRLKGFSGDWKEVQLIKVFQFLKSYSISREGLSKEQGNHFCIHYGDIHACYETDFLDFKTQKNIPRIVDENYNIQQKDYLKEGDIVMADASEDYEGVGEAIVVLNLEDKIAVGGLHTIVLRDFAGETMIKFRGYLFAGENVRNKLRTKATGTSVYSVTKNTLESLVLILPPIEEQTAIAQVLEAADREIQLLKTKTEKLREQKKGLMQVLLTGKIRLHYDI